MPSEVRLSSNVLIISFRRPVSVNVDRIANYSDYFSAARGGILTAVAFRIALSRRVRLNTMVAGERLFVDLLPDEWTGPTPSLPQRVIEDLSRRVREAEKRSRQQQMLERQKYALRRTAYQGIAGSRPARLHFRAFRPDCQSARNATRKADR